MPHTPEYKPLIKLIAKLVSSEPSRNVKHFDASDTTDERAVHARSWCIGSYADNRRAVEL